MEYFVFISLIFYFLNAYHGIFLIKILRQNTAKKVLLLVLAPHTSSGGLMSRRASIVSLYKISPSFQRAFNKRVASSCSTIGAPPCTNLMSVDCTTSSRVQMSSQVLKNTSAETKVCFGAPEGKYLAFFLFELETNVLLKFFFFFLVLSKKQKFFPSSKY